MNRKPILNSNNNNIYGLRANLICISLVVLGLILSACTSSVGRSIASSSQNEAVLVDTTPPVLTLTATPNNLERNRAATFQSIPSIDEALTYSCSVDNVLLSACSNPVTFSNLSDGAHVFRLTATDVSGNNSTLYSYSWVIDATPPAAIVLIAKPAPSTISTTATFTFSPSESGAALECKLDSGNFSSCVSPAYYSNLSVGSHAFSIRSRDVAGNISSVTTFSWAITSPNALVYFPKAACATGRIEIYLDNAPHPDFQYINTGECIELNITAASSLLKVRCVDPTNVYAPSDFVGPAVNKGAADPSICRSIYRSS